MNEGRPIKVKVHDKRKTREPSSSDRSSPTAAEEMSDTGADSNASKDRVSDISRTPLTGDDRRADNAGRADASQPDYRDLYLRAVADLDNERKRFKMREREQAERAVRIVIEGLLPVLDNFERAISHGEGGDGVALVFKELKTALEREGLEEIPADEAAFDPNLHDAVEAREVEGLETPTVIEVHRRGYLLNGQLLRPAMVVVGRPREPVEESLKGTAEESVEIAE